MIFTIRPQSGIQQIFDIDLSGRTYRFRLTWSAPSTCWMLDILSDDDVAIVRSIPVITGINLLDPYPDAGIAGSLYAYTAGTDDPPTLESMGRESILLYVT